MIIKSHPERMNPFLRVTHYLRLLTVPHHVVEFPAPPLPGPPRFPGIGLKQKGVLQFKKPLMGREMCFGVTSSPPGPYGGPRGLGVVL